jgi:DNA mismatch repair protein MutL
MNKPVLSPFPQQAAPVQTKLPITPVQPVVNTAPAEMPPKPPEKPPEREHSYALNDSGAFQTDYTVKPLVIPPAPPILQTPDFQTSEPRETVPTVIPVPEETPEPQKAVRLVGEAFGTYIIVERGNDELLFIDKHAAHERMLYEKLKAQGGQAVQQMLLEPVTVTLDKNEYSAVLESISAYEAAGFEIDDFGSGTVIVRSAPMILGGEDIAAAVMEIAGYLQSAKNDITTEKLDWLYHNVACRAAVKAGDESSPQELAALVERMEKEDIRYCPHGRPVSIVMKKRDLERQFGRV